MDLQNITISELYALLKKDLTDQTIQINKSIADNVEKLAGKIEKTTDKINILETKYVALERKIRKNNVVIFGINTQGLDLLQTTLTTLNDLLDVNLEERDINNIYCLGRKPNSPVLLEFVSYLKKLTLFKNKDKLNSLEEKSIAIANDICAEDREIQRKLRKHLKKVKEHNPNAKIKGSVLIIDNKTYTLSQLEREEENFENSSTEDDDYTSEGEKEVPIAAPSTVKNNITGCKQLEIQHKPNRRNRRKSNTPSPKKITINRGKKGAK